VTNACFQLSAPTRPARDALLAYLTGLDEQLPGVWAEARFAARAARLAELRAAAGGQVAIAFEDGGLLRSLDAWQNALLPVAFHAADEVEAANWRARGILAACGHQLEEFVGRADATLTLYERRLLGFVKAMLVEPRLFIIDRLFEDLGFEEQKSVSGWLRLYRNRYPLRGMLYVGLTQAAPELLAGFVPLDAMKNSLEKVS